MESYDLKVAHKAARNNRKILARDSKCGCYYYLVVFSSSEIEEWCPEFDGEEM